MIDVLPRGGSIHVDGGHSLPVVVLCCFVVVLPVFERGAVCVVPVLVSLIFSVHGGHSLPVVWMCVFHGGHIMPVVWMCVCVWLLLWNEPFFFVCVAQSSVFRSAAMRCSCTYLCRKLLRLLPAFWLTHQHGGRDLLEAWRS